MESIFDSVKIYASRMKDETTKVAKHIWCKTNDLVDKTKLSVAISDIEGKINDIYKQIGETVYNSYESGDEYSDSINECCEKISALNDEIVQLKKELTKYKSGVQCGCGQYNEKGASYCSKCGASINSEYEEYTEYEEDEQVVIINPVVEE